MSTKLARNATIAGAARKTTHPKASAASQGHLIG